MERDIFCYCVFVWILGFVLVIMTHGFVMKLYLIKLLIVNFDFGL